MTRQPPLQSGTGKAKVVAVVVTYNRQELLKLTLAGIAAGQSVPDTVVVVNNASTDITRQYLDQLDYPLPLDIVHLSTNVGGAGGFTVGIDRALVRHGADLVWVMDDDTEPTEGTLKNSVRAWANYADSMAPPPAFVASKVVWDDGRDHPMNTMRTMFGAGASRRARAAAVGARPIRSASFVSVLMDATVMRRVGLPIADFFIWNDDFEYTTRLAHHRNAIATEDSVVLHHTKTFGTTDAKPGPRFYNDVRNKLWVFCRRRTLTPWEKILYGGSTVRLWISTLLRTDEKKTYAAYLVRGIKDAIKPFRSNALVLEGIYDLELPRQAAHSTTVADSKFSVLMCTYRGDHPEYLDRAIASNTVEQTLPPHELVLVKDGPLGAELEEVINTWSARADSGELAPIVVVEFAENRGLARALNEGLTLCSYELVARADSDDISQPKRFEQQVQYMLDSQADLVGSSMYEVSADASTVESVRHALTDQNALGKVLTQRNPFFHPTVIFKKSSVVATGGYEEVPGAEDYWLWARMSKAGYRLHNIDQPLVSYRAGAGAYSKRGGFTALKKDCVVQRTLYNGEIIGKAQLLQNMLVRTIYRITPQKLRIIVFRALIGRSRSAEKRTWLRGEDLAHD